MRLVHTDGRTQTVPNDAYDRHLDTYTRAGWAPHQDQTSDAPAPVVAEGIKIVSQHNAQKTVTEEEFAATYESKGWRRLEEAEADGEASEATGDENAPQEGAQRATRKGTAR